MPWQDATFAQRSCYVLAPEEVFSFPHLNTSLETGANRWTDYAGMFWLPQRFLRPAHAYGPERIRELPYLCTTFVDSQESGTGIRSGQPRWPLSNCMHIRVLVVQLRAPSCTSRWLPCWWLLRMCMSVAHLLMAFMISLAGLAHPVASACLPVARLRVASLFSLAVVQPVVRIRVASACAASVHVRARGAPPGGLPALLVSFVHKRAMFNVCQLRASDLWPTLVVAMAMCNVWQHWKCSATLGRCFVSQEVFRAPSTLVAGKRGQPSQWVLARVYVFAVILLRCLSKHSRTNSTLAMTKYGLCP